MGKTRLSRSEMNAYLDAMLKIPPRCVKSEAYMKAYDHFLVAEKENKNVLR